MQPLKDLQSKASPKKRRQQTAEDQMAVFQMWNVVLGGETVN
jgi:hypothetical protein